MHITKEDIEKLREGLFDLTSEQNREKMQEIRKRMDVQQRILNRSNAKRSSTKEGRRFSQDTKEVLYNHVQDLRSVAKKAHAMARELKMHAQDLEQKADDLTELFWAEGQGPAFAED